MYEFLDFYHMSASGHFKDTKNGAKEYDIGTDENWWCTRVGIYLFIYYFSIYPSLLVLKYII